MRKIIYAQSVSLDGYIEDRDGKIDWTTPSKELHLHFNEREKEMDTHLYGRKVYKIMQFWEDADRDPDLPEYMREYARVWQQQKKVVFSTTLVSVGDGYELRKEVDPEEINRWKNAPGRNMMVGGSGLGASFLQHGLIDEIHLYIVPFLLGGGKPMFSSGKEQNMKLIESQTFPDDLVMLKYPLKSKS